MQQIHCSPRSSRGRLTDNIVSLYLLQGLNYLIPMAVLPYLVRVLGMDMYGLLAFSQSFAQYFNILTDYGFNFSATRALVQQQHDSTAISRLFCSVFALKLLLGSLGGLTLFVIVNLVPRFRPEAQYFYIGYIAVAGNVLFPVWYYQGIQKMRYISVLTGATRLLSAAALFIFVHRPEDALLALGIQSGGMLLSGILGMAIVLRHFRVRLVKPSARDMQIALMEGWHLFVSTAAISLYTNTNVFLVGIFAGNVEAGYFSAAEKIVRAMNGLIIPISQAVFPHVNALVKESRATALRFARKMLAYLLPITLLPSLTVLLLASRIAQLCFGDSGIGSIPVLRWIALLPVAIAVSNVLGIQTMVPFGLDKQFSRILVFAGIFNVVLAVPLVKLYGAKGAGASVFLTEVLVTAGMIISLERHELSIFRSENLA